MKNNFLFAILTFVLLACSKGKVLEPLSVAKDLFPLKTTLNSHFCTPSEGPNEDAQYFIFLVDASTSNLTSDPSGGKRFLGLFDFLTVNSFGPRDKFLLISFGDHAGLFPKSKQSLIDNTDLSSSVFTPDSISFYNELESYNQSRSDTGNTNLSDALGKAYSSIIHEQKFQEKRFFTPPFPSPPFEPINYKIFIITDGEATDENGLTPPGLNDSILNSVDLIRSTVSGLSSFESVRSVTVSTAFYFDQNLLEQSPIPPEYQRAKDLLGQIASRGGGTAKEFKEGPINYDSFLSLKTNIKYKLAFYFLGLNGFIWNELTKKFELDTDEDFLSDAREKQLGSNPLKKDSDNDGLSDYIQLLLTGEVCNEGCYDKNSTFRGCERFKKTNVFVDTDKDGLNDCEESALGSSITNPDTNNNLIPDNIEIKVGKYPTSNWNLWDDDDNDGVLNQYEIRNQTPIFIKNDLLADEIPSLKYELYKTNSNEDKEDCFNLQVSNLPIANKDSQTIDLSLNLIFQKTTGPGINKKITARKKFDMKEEILFKEDDFK